MPLRSLVAVVLLAAGVAGCMKSGTQRVARFRPGPAGDDAVWSPAPAASFYKVKYVDVDGGGLKAVPGSRRGVGRGDALGFQTADDGTLLAVAGDETFPLDVPVDRVRHVVWCRRVKRPRQFFVETGRVAQGTLEGAGFVAGKFVEAGIHSALYGDEDDDCDDDAGPWRFGGGRDHHSHHHGGGGGGGGNHAGGGGNQGGGKPPKPDRPDKPVRIGARNP